MSWPSGTRSSAMSTTAATWSTIRTCRCSGRSPSSSTSSTTYAVDELIIALPTSRREQVTRLVDRGFRRRVKIKFVTGSRRAAARATSKSSVSAGGSYIGFAPGPGELGQARARHAPGRPGGCSLSAPLLG